MGWQDRAKTLLSRPEMAAALNKLSINRDKESADDDSHDTEDQTSDSEGDISPR